MTRRTIEALVQSGASESRYVRTGSGHRLLVLLPRHRAAFLDGPLPARLATEFCVIVPDMPARAGSACAPARAWAVDDWLVRFLDGTGIDRCSIIAEACLAGALHRVARDDERVHRVVLLGDDGGAHGPDAPLAWPHDGAAEAQLADALIERLRRD